MKKIASIFIVAFSIFSFNTPNPSKYTIISGKIINNYNNLKKITIINNEGFYKEIKINRDNTFLDTLQSIKSGYYRLYGEIIYLDKGDHLVVELDLKSRGNYIFFSKGRSVAANNYLLKDNTFKKILETTYTDAKNSIYYMEPDAFLMNVDKIKGQMLAVLSNTPNLSKEFIELEKRTIDYKCLQIISMYPMSHTYITKKKDYIVPDNVTKPLKYITNNINIKDYKEIPIYDDILQDYFLREYRQSSDKGQDAIIQKIKNFDIERLQNSFAFTLVLHKLNLENVTNENLDKIVSHIKILTKDKRIIEEVDKFVDKFKKSVVSDSKIVPSPSFSYEDINGKTVSLSDLKGKLVYIDVWATWCGPCRYELPYFKKLKKEYHNKNIHFVSISVDKQRDKAIWEKMVKGKKLGGVQLFSDYSFDSEFVKAYLITGIPRFILLDKEGNIISGNAPRPSHEKEIRKLLDKWLKK